MSDSARADILARVRGASRDATRNELLREQWALGRAPAAPLPDGDTSVAFLTNVLKNQGSVDCAADRGEVVRAIAAYLYEKFRSHRLVAGNDRRLAALPWRDAGVLPRFGAIEQGEKVALSYARLGVVETGAVLLWTGKANPAANNLLAEHHIVLVDVADLTPTLEDAWDRVHKDLEKEARPRGLNFIAGPSSTADIEGRLVYGAHGPQYWHVILVGAIPEGAEARARASISAG